ncbi:helix-turn-helix domain-containing protein [Microbacterium sp. GXF7504]
MSEPTPAPPHPDRGPSTVDDAARALGARIRALRQERGLTLAKAAAEAELSHSFLSQVERGLERLSMASLFRIARALGTTQQDLLTGADETPAGQGAYHVFRQSDGSPLDAGTGPVTVLAQHGSPPFVPMVFSGAFGDDIWWEHAEDEFVYVLDGVLTVILGDEEFRLERGDATYYEGGVRHRWRTDPGLECRALVVKEYRHRD